MPLTKILLITLTCFWSTIALAQDEFEALSVHSALEYAYSHNPQLNQTRELINHKEAEKRLIFGLTAPEIRYTKEGLDGNGFMEQRWSVSQSLDFPTTIIHRNTKVDKEYSAMKAQYEASKLNLKADVKKAYSMVAFTLEIVHLRDEQVQLAREIESISLERNRVGESSKLDVLQAQLQLSEARNNYNDAISELQNARYELFNTIGLSPGNQHYGIEFPDTLTYIPVNFDQEAVMNSISRHPAVLRDKAFIRSAESEVKVKRSAYLPALTGTYFRQDFGNGFDFNGFEISISVPIWFALDQAPNVARAKSMLRSGELELQKNELALKTEAEQAWHSFHNVEQQIKDYNESIRSSSSELLSLTQEAYRVGEIPLITLLQAQRTYLTSQERYLTALRDYHIQLINIEKFLQKDLIYAE